MKRYQCRDCQARIARKGRCKACRARPYRSEVGAECHANVKAAPLRAWRVVEYVRRAALGLPLFDPPLTGGPPEDLFPRPAEVEEPDWEDDE